MKHKLKGLARAYRRLPWLIGDAMVELEDREGEKSFGVFGKATGLSEYQLYDMARVARQWPEKDRVFLLPWSYYRDCGSDIPVAKRVLDATVRQGWSREQMRKCLRAIRELEEAAS